MLKNTRAFRGLRPLSAAPGTDALLAARKQKRTGKDMMNVIRNRSVVAASPAPDEGFITKHELARRVKKTTRTIENWQKLGFIPYLKAGKSVLYDWAEVQAHLRHHFGVSRLPGKPENN